MTRKTKAISIEPFDQSRRDFILKAGLFSMAMNFPGEILGKTEAKRKMGIVVHSYGLRWNSTVSSQNFPGFQNALQLLGHCHTLGAGGIQVGVQNWNRDFASQLRQESQALGMFIEGSIGLPRLEKDSATFEKQIEIAKSAGVSIFRTVCLGGRRYETFKSRLEFDRFKEESLNALKIAAKIAEKHQVRLAIENHKDWRAKELVEIIKWIDNKWAGVTLDFGNNISLLEDPDEVIEILAPYAFSTHIKDMGLQAYDYGFLLSEIPLGTGVVDLKKAVEICQKYNPDINFNLEMITRDPLKIPCLDPAYWPTFGELPAKDLARTLSLVRDKSHSGSLPIISHLKPEEQLATEEDNIISCMQYSQNELNLK
ncbi:sugar phosphate isomerase/epimerase family protein [Cecembia sp.]|uniref:sugar phosphate isomerase/epimerase family protein n=1 Tax=Cecembia sp. TaxID=1898110 RepID=UPI0025C0B3EA|nr:sugar phosphate isomerase/epimerase family protein [Cecembia sp.]